MPFVTLRGPGWKAETQVDAVIFDLDGVITDTATVHAAAWKALFDRFLAGRPVAPGEDHRPFTDDDYLRFVDGKARHDGVADFLASRGIALERATPTMTARRRRSTGWGTPRTASSSGRSPTEGCHSSTRRSS